MILTAALLRFAIALFALVALCSTGALRATGRSTHDENIGGAGLGLPGSVGCNDADGDGFFFEDDCGTAPDCNDADSDTWPEAPEQCDGYDNDCDGALDESCELCDDPASFGAGVAATSSAFPWVSDWVPSTFWTGHELGIAWESPTQAMDGRLGVNDFVRICSTMQSVGVSSARLSS